ncbi:MAG: hypothetical protein SFX72_00760 [Isosphaeraceae bacterium]|nr:hypothetical protein [Isosphaeraceae bacterium]
MWTCTKCGTKVDSGFDVCWQCGTSSTGVEDPSFRTADDAPRIDAPDVTDVGPEISPPHPIGPIDDLVVCYEARDYLEAKMLADLLVEAGIPAFADGYDLRESLGMMNAGPRVRVRSDLAAPARRWIDDFQAERAAEGELSRDEI